jgi:4-hydroxy-4-methyl-2-oxoglutarate aldolase
VLMARAAQLGVSTIHEAAGGIGALPTAIRPMTPGLVASGRAVTVSGPGADNLWIHRGLAVAGPGDVLVVHVSGHYESGYWGEVLSWAARARGLAGVVIDGCVRDSDRLTAIGLPVFARGLCMKGTTKLPEGVGAINQPIHIGEVTIAERDLVVGDGDGVVVIPSDLIEDVLSKSVERMEREAEVVSALQRGASTITLLGLPTAGPS